MLPDLSAYHHPVSRFIEVVAANLNTYCLSTEQIDSYQQNGYLSGIPILTESQVQQLKAELDQLIDPNYQGNQLFYEFNSNESTDPDRILFHALGAWRIAPAFHDILWHPAFLLPASQLLQGAVRFWHDQLFCKPAQHGGVVSWHQDYSYWTRTQPMAHLTCWIALDEAKIDNGCVHYIPGSHQWNLLPITGLAGDLQAIEDVLTPEQRETFNHPQAVELKAGEATFHHPLMVHGSFENLTNRPRRATVINVFRDGVTSGQAEPMLHGTNAIPIGQPMKGQFYPLLYEPEI